MDKMGEQLDLTLDDTKTKTIALDFDNKEDPYGLDEFLGKPSANAGKPVAPSKHLASVIPKPAPLVATTIVPAAAAFTLPTLDRHTSRHGRPGRPIPPPLVKPKTVANPTSQLTKRSDGRKRLLKAYGCPQTRERAEKALQSDDKALRIWRNAASPKPSESHEHAHRYRSMHKLKQLK